MLPAGAAHNAMNNVATNAFTSRRKGPKNLESCARSQATPAPGAAAPATRDWAALSRSFWLAVLPPLCVAWACSSGLWAVVSTTTGGSIPSPVETWKQALDIFSNPFYSERPQRIAWAGTY